MLRKYLLYALASTSLIFTSCMDDFLERNPYGAIDETTFYTEAEHANLGVSQRRKIAINPLPKC